MTIRQIFTDRVESVRAADTLREAARQMRDAGVGMLVVQESGQMIGVVTDRDLVVRGLADGLDGDAPVRLAMTAPAQSVNADLSLEQAIAAMRAGQHRRLLVVGDEGEPLGVVSIDDLLQRLAFFARAIGDVVEHRDPNHFVS